MPRTNRRTTFSFGIDIFLRHIKVFMGARNIAQSSVHTVAARRRQHSCINIFCQTPRLFAAEELQGMDNEKGKEQQCIPDEQIMRSVV